MNLKVGDELNSSERIDIEQHSPDLFGEIRGSDNSDGKAGSSSSGSDSDSDSDSSDSGSDSGSHSKSRSRSQSRSPVGSGSGSSSDSESDASANSKEGSDEDVDIMTSDDDKEPKHKLQASEPGFSRSPNPWGTPDGIAVQNGLDEKQDDQVCDAVEIEKDFPGDRHEAETPLVHSSIPHKDGEKPMEETKSISPDQNEFQDRQHCIGSLFEDEENTVKDSFKHEQSASSQRISKGKSRKGSDSKHFDKKSEHIKRLKAESLAQPPIFGSGEAQFSESPRSSSPDRLADSPYRGPTTQMVNRADRDGNTEFGVQKGYNQAIPGKSSSDFQQSGQRSYDQSARAKTHDTTERSDKHGENLGRGRKYTSNEDGYANERKAPSNSKEGSGGGKYSVPSESHYRKHNDMAGKLKEAGQVSNSHIGSSPNHNRSGVDRSPLVNGSGSILQRELSDLELGELREPMPEQPQSKKQFERKTSFKQSENKLSASENWNLDSSRGKSVGKATLDSGKPSSPNISSGVRGNLDGLNRRKTPEHHVEDVTRSHHRVVQSQTQHVSRADPTKDSKRQTSNTAVDMTDGQRDAPLAEGNNSGRKRRDSFSDENSCSYSKYEKDKPELKGPIKDFSQYKEYVQEYRDKYDNYCSLNKILENYRNEFHKLGKDLELAKDRDTERYRNITGQLRESYQQCGERHKRLKKIFVVLHEELKHLKQRIKDFALSYTKD